MKIFNRQLVLKNSVWSVLQTIISGLVLFFLYRYLILSLGAEQLGLWSVILASTSFAKLSDMGLMGSVVKYIAKYKALEDDKRASEILETATISIVVIVGLFLAIASPLFEYAIIYAIPTESISEGVKILPLAILSLWINSIAGVFLSGLDGCQRMDLKSIIID